MRFTGNTIVVLLLFLVIGAGAVTLFVLLVRALLKYLRAEPVRTRKNEIKKTLGEALKAERLRCNMTQEFVAETIGVSRQAVSKWETGAADPSTANLLALAKLACCRRSCCTTRKTEIHNIRKRRPKGRLFLASIAH